MKEYDYINMDIYSLDELIDKLENIKYGLDTALNVPKALYSLSLEIMDINLQIQEIKDSIAPMQA